MCNKLNEMVSTLASFSRLCRGNWFSKAVANEMLEKMCDTYGTDAVGDWLASNSPDVCKWLA